MIPEPFDESLLTAYLDGELSPGEIEQVELVIAASPRLKHSLSELKCLRRLIMSALQHAEPQPALEPARSMICGTPIVSDTARPEPRDVSQLPWLLDEATKRAISDSPVDSPVRLADADTQSSRRTSRIRHPARISWLALAGLAAALLIAILGPSVPSGTRGGSLSLSKPEERIASASSTEERTLRRFAPPSQSTPVVPDKDSFRVGETELPLPLPRVPQGGSELLARDTAEGKSAKDKAILKRLDAKESEAIAVGEVESPLNLMRQSPDRLVPPVGTSGDVEGFASNESFGSDVPLVVAAADPAAMDPVATKLRESISDGERTEEQYYLGAIAFDKDLSGGNSGSGNSGSGVSGSTPMDGIRARAIQPIEIPEPTPSLLNWIDDQMRLGAHTMPPFERLWIALQNASSADVHDPSLVSRVLREGTLDPKLQQEEVVLFAQPQSASPVLNPIEEIAFSAFRSSIQPGRANQHLESADFFDESAVPRNGDPGDRSAPPSESGMANRFVPQPVDAHRFRYRLRSADDGQPVRHTLATPGEFAFESSSHLSEALPMARIAAAWFREEPPSASSRLGSGSPDLPDDFLEIKPSTVDGNSPLFRIIVPLGGGADVLPHASGRPEGTPPLRLLLFQFHFATEQTSDALLSLKSLGIEWDANHDWPSTPVVLLTRLNDSSAERLQAALQIALEGASSQDDGAVSNSSNSPLGAASRRLVPVNSEAKVSESAATWRSVWLILVHAPSLVREHQEDIER